MAVCNDWTHWPRRSLTILICYISIFNFILLLCSRIVHCYFKLLLSFLHSLVHLPLTIAFFSLSLFFFFQFHMWRWTDMNSKKGWRIVKDWDSNIDWEAFAHRDSHSLVTLCLWSCFLSFSHLQRYYSSDFHAVLLQSCIIPGNTVCGVYFTLKLTYSLGNVCGYEDCVLQLTQV